MADMTQFATSTSDPAPVPGTGPLATSGDRHAAELARVQAARPSSFTVGAYVDWRRKVVLEATYDRRLTNLWGLTAYARAWWNDAGVTPNPTAGAAAGIESRYEFKPR